MACWLPAVFVPLLFLSLLVFRSHVRQGMTPRHRVLQADSRPHPGPNPGPPYYVSLVILGFGISPLASALKADSTEETLRCFNKVIEMKVSLRPNLLSGVLNQCAKAGLMDDCMRVVMEMKRELSCSGSRRCCRCRCCCCCCHRHLVDGGAFLFVCYVMFL